MVALQKYLAELRALRHKHAWEVVTQPGEITERNYAYAIGFQSGLEKAEKIAQEVLNADKGLNT